MFFYSKVSCFLFDSIRKLNRITGVANILGQVSDSVLYEWNVIKKKLILFFVRWSTTSIFKTHISQASIHTRRTVVRFIRFL